MAKGGSQRQEVIMPEFAETTIQQGLGMGRDLAPLAATFQPDPLPVVAALSPQEQMSNQYTDMAANAFGMPTADTSSYMPPPTQYAGGIQGYSAQPMVQEAIDTTRAQSPGYADYVESFGLDPMTGEVGSRAPQNQPVALEMQGGGRGK